MSRLTLSQCHTALYDASFEIPRGTITGAGRGQRRGKIHLVSADHGVCARRAGRYAVGEDVKEALVRTWWPYVPSRGASIGLSVLVQDVGGMKMGRMGHMGVLAAVQGCRPCGGGRRPAPRQHDRVSRHRQIGELSAGSASGSFWRGRWQQNGPTGDLGLD